MSTLAIEMPSGIAGDMLLAALIDAGAKVADIEQGLAQLGVGPLPLHCQEIRKQGLRAMQLHVQVPQDALWQQPHHHHGHEHHHHHHEHEHTHQHSHDEQHHSISHDSHRHDSHRPYAVIRDLLAHAPLPARVIERAQRVFRVLAEAEAAVHGAAVDAVIFHEVGGLDAIADVVGCCLALEQLGVERVCVGPLLLGQGHVHCAHGRMPVPVPAVQEMITRHQVPTRRVDFASGELTTPTGCALAIGLADTFTLPSGVSQGTGIGAGHRDISGLPGILRVSLWNEAAVGVQGHWNSTIYELRAVIDDSNPQDLAAACSQLRQEGARDVWLQAITMKKGRLGSELVVLATSEDCDALAACILTHTSSIGLRRSPWQRWELPRRLVHVSLDGHTVRGKAVTLPDGQERVSIEHDDLLQAAAAIGISPMALRSRAQGLLEAQAGDNSSQGDVCDPEKP